MSSQGKQRFVYNALLFSLGGVAAQAVSFWWFPSASVILRSLITIAGILLAAAVGVYFEARVGLGSSRRPDGEQPGEMAAVQEQQYQAEIAQQYQAEIEQLKLSHQQELEKLSLELALHAERHEQDGGRQQLNQESTIELNSDITEQVRMYQNLEKAVEDRTLELSTVLEVSKRIATTLELEPLLNLILDQIETILPYSGAAIFTLDGEALEVVACHVPSLSMPKRMITLSVERLGRFLPVISEKKVIILDDVHGDSPLALAFQESYPQSGFMELPHARSWIGIPLVIRDKVMGLLSLTHSDPGYYTQTHARLGQSITYQVAIAIENARLYEKAQNLAALEERNRIARELHDSVTQLLYGITLYCSASKRTLKSENLKQVEQNLVEIKENALQALQEMRLLILELNPPLLQKEGLVKALAASLEMIETRTGLETELKTDGLDQLPHTIEPGLYRIAMEALNNLVRYARAKKVIVDIQQVNNWVFLEIRDNGVGFDLQQAKTSSGMGLQNMEARARQLGGRLEIQTTPGAGTCIRAEVPC